MMLGLVVWPAVADKQKTSQLPEMAFLEFLAEMEEVDGKLVSASDLMELNDPSALKKGQISQEQLALLRLLQQGETGNEQADNKGKTAELTTTTNTHEAADPVVNKKEEDK